MKRHVTVLACCALLLGTFSIADPARAMERNQDLVPTYTLHALYRLALERSEPIGIASEAVAIAEQRRKQALSVLLPTLSGSGDYVRYSEKIVSESLVQPQWTGSWGISAGQRITLNGRELTALHMAETNIDRRNQDLAVVKEATLFAVAAAYFELAKARKVIDIALADVRRLKLHRDAVALKLKLAEVPKTELFRTEAELARAEADRTRAENAHAAAAVSLARQAGLDGPFDIADISDATLLPPDPDVDVLKTLATAHRAELKSLALQTEMADKQIRYQQGAFWPMVGWEMAWMRFEQNPATGYDESAYVGLSVSFDFFDGGRRRAQVMEARALKHQAELVRSETARQIAEQVEQAWLEMKTQESVIASYASQARYAQENYRAVTRLFDHGMANSVDVVDANTLLVTAERELVEARYNLQLAVLRVERATGTFLASVEQACTFRPPAEHTENGGALSMHRESDHGK